MVDNQISKKETKICIKGWKKYNKINMKTLKSIIESTSTSKASSLIFSQCEIPEINTDFSLDFDKQNTNERKLYSMSFINCKFKSEWIVAIWRRINGITTLDLSENNIRLNDARYICDNLKDLDFIYFYKNTSPLSGLNAENAIF